MSDSINKRNSRLDSPALRRALIWWGIPAVILGLWTGYWHWRWLQSEWALFSGILAFFSGLLVIILGQAAARLAIGAFQNGRRWLWSREAFRIAGWTALFFVSTFVLFYSVELWRGKRASARVVEEARAQGETFDLKEILPGPVPDEQNFARAPFFDRLYEISATQRGDPDLLSFNIVAQWEQWPAQRVKEIRYASWLDQEKTDFRSWLEFLGEGSTTTGSADEPFDAPSGRPVPEMEKSKAAELVLVSLKVFEDELDELREYSSRPYCRFPLDYTRQMWTENRGLALLNGFTRILRLRASAQLATGQADAAFEDVQLSLRLADYARQQPWAITSGRRLMILTDALQPVWEGLAERQWREEQVRSLQAPLESLDLLGDYPAAIQVGAFALADFCESIIPTASREETVPLFEVLHPEEGSGLGIVRLFYPTGWSLQDQAVIHQARLRELDSFSRAAALGEMPEKRTGAAVLRRSSDPFFRVFIEPRFQESLKDLDTFYFAQSVVNQAVLACALERYRLTNGEYPEALDTLDPRFVRKLPHDVVTGDPLKYRREAGGFILYSVGFNRTDDEGRPTPREKGGGGEPLAMPDPRKNDWVWTYPGQ